MLTVSVPLPEGAQITSYTQSPLPPEIRTGEKMGAFAGKLDQALSGKTAAGETGPAGIREKPGKVVKSDKKAPKKGGTSSVPDHPGSTSRKISDKAIVRLALRGLRRGTDVGKSVGKNAGESIVENGSSTLRLDLKNESGETGANGIDGDPAMIKMQSTGSEPVEAADQKSFSPGEGTASLMAVSVQTPDQTETAGIPAPGGDLADGLEKSGAGRGSSPGENGKTVIEVRDFRTRESAAASEGAGPSDVANTAAGEEGSLEVERESVDPQIRLVRAPFGNGRGNESIAARASRSDGFSAYVRENLSNQIVKQSGIILRNNNSGEIRLVLKPEHLGRVRLRIQLDENRLSGRIFVDSSFVKESFEQNLEALYRAFRNSGFETTGFEVFVDGRGTNDGAPKDSGLFAAKTLKQLDDAVPILEEIDQQSELINLVI